MFQKVPLFTEVLVLNHSLLLSLLRRHNYIPKHPFSPRLYGAIQQASMTATPRIPELPQEILQSIINYLPGEALKNARRSSRNFAMMAEPRLFEYMVLVPYKDCLEEFAKIMSSSPIASHVRTLYYDAESRYDDDWVAPLEDEGSIDVLEILEAYGLTARDETTEVLLLSDCLRTLPNIKTLRVREATEARSGNYDGTLLSERSAYFGRLIDRAPAAATDGFALTKLHQPDGSLMQGSRTMLFACVASGSKVTEFIADGLDPRNFLRFGHADGLELCTDHQYDHTPPKELSMFERAFRPLKSITLRFEVIEYAYPIEYWWSAKEGLGAVLTSACKLQELRVTGTDSEVTSFRHKSWLGSLMRVGQLERVVSRDVRTKAVFPCLKLLELAQVACQESELAALVRLHKDTLQTLRLTTITLLRDQEGCAPPPCFVRFLKTIRTCRVPYVELSGKFSNLMYQRWDIAPTSDSPNGCKPIPADQALESRMENWLAGEGEEETICPIEVATVKLDDDGEVIAPPIETKTWGDFSWKSIPVVRRQPMAATADVSDDSSDNSENGTADLDSGTDELDNDAGGDGHEMSPIDLPCHDYVTPLP